MTIPEVLPDFVAYRRGLGAGAWGALHIVLDDGNVSDASVRWCDGLAAETGDAEGARLARILLGMSRSQRSRLSRIVDASIAGGPEQP